MDFVSQSVDSVGVEWCRPRRPIAHAPGSGGISSRKLLNSWEKAGRGEGFAELVVDGDGLGNSSRKVFNLREIGEGGVGLDFVSQILLHLVEGRALVRETIDVGGGKTMLPIML